MKKKFKIIKQSANKVEIIENNNDLNSTQNTNILEESIYNEDEELLNSDFEDDDLQSKENYLFEEELLEEDENDIVENIVIKKNSKTNIKLNINNELIKDKYNYDYLNI